MSLWVSTYFAAYLTFCLWSHFDDIRNKRDPLWYAIAEVASNICLVVAALSFWLPAVRTISASLLLGLFVAGCAVFLGQAAVSCRRHISGPDLSLPGKFFVAISGSALGIVISAPLLFWGFTSTVLRSYAGT